MNDNFLQTSIEDAALRNREGLRLRRRGVCRVHRATGFTLMELLVVIAIVAILAINISPSLTTSLASARMSGEINAVLGALNFARSAALSTGQTVSLCASPCSVANCTPTATQSWSSGWAVCANNTTTLRTMSALSTDGLTATVVQFTQMGYPLCNGTACNGNVIYLHNSKTSSFTASISRCIFFIAGIYYTQRNTTSSTTTCP